MYQASPNRYQEMEYRRCGKSGIKLSALSLGLWHNLAVLTFTKITVVCCVPHLIWGLRISI